MTLRFRLIDSNFARLERSSFGSLGRLALAKAAAEEALRAADETQSEFRHHRQLGLVRDDHKDAMSQLRRIASA
jgi:hypothetical protein